MKAHQSIETKIGKATWTATFPVKWRWTKYTEREHKHDWKSGMPGICDEAGCEPTNFSPGDSYLRIETETHDLVHRVCEQCAAARYGLKRGMQSPE